MRQHTVHGITVFFRKESVTDTGSFLILLVLLAQALSEVLL